MEQEQWSEWIEWKGGECPIPHAKAGEWQATTSKPSEQWAADRDAKRCVASGKYLARCWRHTNDGGCWHAVAYRVRLTAQQPTTESDRDIDIGDGVDENAAMLARDSAGMVKAVEPVAPFELQIEAEEAPGLLVVAPMERLGATRWGV